MISIDVLWQRILKYEGETFIQVKGGEFKYTVKSGCVMPSVTTRNIPRSNFEKALEKVPIQKVSDLSDLQGPSYIFAIMNDRRIRKNDW